MRGHEEYPNIWKACFEITVDNGGLNRDRPQEIVEYDFHVFIGEIYDRRNLQEAEEYIGNLTDEEIINLACDNEDMIIPEEVNIILNLWFDWYC
uniref:Uncharacterized protein n=1 Tax=Rhizobium phage LG08 TaxID=3129229 RepID=A0AAU8HY26_9CAUD